MFVVQLNFWQLLDKKINKSRLQYKGRKIRRNEALRVKKWELEEVKKKIEVDLIKIKVNKCYWII